jgi:hypothetical protein
MRQEATIVLRDPILKQLADLLTLDHVLPTHGGDRLSFEKLSFRIAQADPDELLKLDFLSEPF